MYLINKSILFIKNILNKNILLKDFILKFTPDFILSKIRYKNIASLNQNNFKSFLINDFILNFNLSPLEDKRGIGRVCREQLDFLEKKFNITEYSKSKNCINFYSSIHYCPEKLFSNTVIMIHDVIPIAMKEFFPIESKIWLNKFKDIAKQAELIITISETSKSDIINFLEISSSKIKVVNNGVTVLKSKFKPKIELPDDYFVFIGSSDKHKNLDVVFRALSLKKDKSIKLVLIGNNLQEKKKVKKLALQNVVFFLGFLEDDEISYVLSKSKGLLFPSYYEGFGLPPMEAALLKIPSICSKKPTMTEFLDDICLFANPDNEKEWLDNMEKLRDNKVRVEIGNKAYNKIKNFTWEKSCNELTEIFKKYKF